MSSVSQTFRQTRENRGILLDEVARRTYIKLPYLKALEEGTVEELPAPVFVYGYIRQYAKLLGLDAAELVQRYQQEVRREPAPLVLAPSRSMADNDSEFDSQSFNGNGNGDRLANGHGNGSGNGHTYSDGLANGFHGPSTSLEFTKSPYLDPGRERLASPSQSGLERTVPVKHDPQGPGGSMEPGVSNAQQEAQRIVAEAHREAQVLKRDAERYAHQVLADLEAEIGRALSIVRNGRQFLTQRRRPQSPGSPSLPDTRRG